MRFSNFYSIGKKRKHQNRIVKILFCIFFTLIFTFNFYNNINSPNQINYSDENGDNNENLFNFNQENLETAADISILQNPYSKNFDEIRIFFEDNYKSNLNNDIPTYFRYGDENGTITDDTIYSEDNLLIYNSLLKSEFDQTEIFDNYLKLKSTPLWYEDTSEQFEYGFVRSVDNSTGLVKNSDRYLVDNLLPIFLLIENIGENIDVISINSQKPKDLIEEMFLLMQNEYWDEDNKGFNHDNSTTPNKYSESNFFSILANLLIHRTYHQQNLDESIKIYSYYYANQTMNSMENMWDSDHNAYFYYADANWDTFSSGQEYYHLDVNALGIITLLEFWIETGKVDASPYLERATYIYDSLDANLWDETGYHNISYPTWSSLFDSSYDLRANSLMLEACLKLFEHTGNFTYYDRAVNISKSFENNFYDSVNNAYTFSFSDNSKNLNSNLKLHESYLKASEIYSSTLLKSEYNLTETVPDYLINQDVMNLTSVYSFNKENQYYNPGNDSYVPFTVNYSITDVDINYLLKYPNGTFLNKYENQIIDPATSHNFNHTIEETLPLGEGYYIYIWANKTYFRLTETLKRFNVVSGLKNETIKGLPDVLYQGQTINVTILVNYTRNEDLTITSSLEGEDIINFPSQELNFTSSTELNVSFDLTTKFGVAPGPSEIIFNFRKGNIIYLSVKKVIEIGYSFSYEHLIYQSKVVRGQNIDVSLVLTNFLPNTTQSLNVSFKGLSDNTIETFIQEETLNEDEMKSVSYNLKTLEISKSDSIKVEMSILQNTTVFYTEELTIEIIPEYEIISVSFPGQISQGSHASLIIIIQNNKGIFESFSLFINGRIVQANIDELIPGVNWIMKDIIPTINPYELGTKVYRIVLKDSENEEIALFYFEVVLELSTFNLIIFFFLPSIIPIGIILYFLSKEIKHKKLRR